jgi:hypothetical protein
MSSKLNYFAAREHIADLTRAAERECLARRARRGEASDERDGPFARLVMWLRRRDSAHEPTSRPKLPLNSCGVNEPWAVEEFAPPEP